jgi:hypothetical protein
MHPPQQMFQMITAYWVSQAVGTFAELGFADLLAKSPATARELAAKAGTDADATFRLCRTLAALGVLAQTDGKLALTPLGETLRSDVPHSMRDMARAQTMPGHWLPWGRFRDTIRTGTRQTGAALGSEIFGHYAKHPDEREAFFGAMHGLASLVAKEAPRVYDASQHRVLCDVGGAAGTIAAGFLDANPQLTGSVLELAEVTPLAEQAIRAAKLGDRCRAIAGDFFVEVPAADLYVMKQVLHDWNDEQCRTILGNCAKHLARGGRVLVIEMVIPDDNSPSPAQLMDLNMLAMLPGRERTAGQYAELFGSAGLHLVDVRPTQSPLQVVVAEKR